ncbi:MAG: HNH endonuclease [Candidatus Brocadiales bacterium]|nr:HNH endonuclease [Candidatus Bathyanammoxibius sp.]
MDERTRLRIWDRDEGRCQLCGRPGSEIDHIEAKKMGGRKREWKKWIDRDENLRILCLGCHHKRHHGGRVYT